MRGTVKGSVKKIAEVLNRLGIDYTTEIHGYFRFCIAGRKLGQGSGIAGDNRWFWDDTKTTATWGEIIRQSLKPART